MFMLRGVAVARQHGMRACFWDDVAHRRLVDMRHETENTTIHMWCVSVCVCVRLYQSARDLLALRSPKAMINVSFIRNYQLQCGRDASVGFSSFNISCVCVCIHVCDQLLLFQNVTRSCVCVCSALNPKIYISAFATFYQTIDDRMNERTNSHRRSAEAVFVWCRSLV